MATYEEDKVGNANNVKSPDRSNYNTQWNMHSQSPSELAVCWAVEFTYLGNIWQQVVGDTLRVLSYQAGGMSSNWVEITQQHCVPVLLTQKQQ